MKKITEPLRWALKGLVRLIDRAAYWLYSTHDRKYREWHQNENRTHTEETPYDKRT